MNRLFCCCKAKASSNSVDNDPHQDVDKDDADKDDADKDNTGKNTNTGKEKERAVIRRKDKDGSVRENAVRRRKLKIEENVPASIPLPPAEDLHHEVFALPNPADCSLNRAFFHYLNELRLRERNGYERPTEKEAAWKSLLQEILDRCIADDSYQEFDLHGTNFFNSSRNCEMQTKLLEGLRGKKTVKLLDFRENVMQNYHIFRELILLLEGTADKQELFEKNFITVNITSCNLGDNTFQLIHGLVQKNLRVILDPEGYYFAAENDELSNTLFMVLSSHEHLRSKIGWFYDNFRWVPRYLISRWWIEVYLDPFHQWHRRFAVNRPRLFSTKEKGLMHKACGKFGYDIQHAFNAILAIHPCIAFDVLNDNIGDTALHLASKYGHCDLTVFLLAECDAQRTQNINKKDKKGMTPVHAACYHFGFHNDGIQRLNTIRGIIAYGADVEGLHFEPSLVEHAEKLCLIEKERDLEEFDPKYRFPVYQKRLANVERIFHQSVLQNRQISRAIINAANQLQFPGFALNIFGTSTKLKDDIDDVVMAEIDLIEMYQYYGSYNNFASKTTGTGVDVSPTEWEQLDFLNRQQTIHGLRGDWRLYDEEVFMKDNQVCFQEGKGLHELLWLIKYSLGQSGDPSHDGQMQLVPPRLKVFELEEERHQIERENKMRQMEQERRRDMQEVTKRKRIEREKEIILIEKRKRERQARLQREKEAKVTAGSPVSSGKETEVRAGTNIHVLDFENKVHDFVDSEDDDFL